MRLAKALKEKKMDVRLKEKLLGEGKLSKKEIVTYLKGLEDDQALATEINVGQADSEKKED